MIIGRTLMYVGSACSIIVCMLSGIPVGPLHGGIAISRKEARDTEVQRSWCGGGQRSIATCRLIWARCREWILNCSLLMRCDPCLKGVGGAKSGSVTRANRSSSHASIFLEARFSLRGWLLLGIWLKIKHPRLQLGNTKISNLCYHYLFSLLLGGTGSVSLAVKKPPWGLYRYRNQQHCCI